MANSNTYSGWFPFKNFCNPDSTNINNKHEKDLKQDDSIDNETRCSSCPYNKEEIHANFWNISNKCDDLASKYDDLSSKIDNIPQKHIDLSNKLDDLLLKYTDILDKHGNLISKLTENDTKFANIIDIIKQNSSEIEEMKETLWKQTKDNVKLTRRVSYLRSISKYCTSWASAFVFILLIFLLAVILSSVAYLYLLQPELTKENIEKIINIYSFIVSTALIPLLLYAFCIFFLYVDVKSLKNKINP